MLRNVQKEEKEKRKEAPNRHQLNHHQILLAIDFD
jgi:hypothetical protein